MKTKQLYKRIGNGDLKTTVYNIYGKEVTDGLLDINYTYEDIAVTGFVGKPEIARGNRTYQQFFINKRFIKDKTLSAGTEQAFKGLLPIGKFGFLILNLEIDPSKIDVNVHPTKLEIRFQEEQKVFKAVYHSIREALLKGDLIKNTEKPIQDNTIKRTQTEVIATAKATLANEIQKIEQQKNTEKISTIENLKHSHVDELSEIKLQEEKKKVGLFGLLKKKNIEEEVENNAIQEIYASRNLGDEPLVIAEKNEIIENKEEQPLKKTLEEQEAERPQINLEENIEQPILEYSTAVARQSREITEEKPSVLDAVMLKEDKVDFNEMYNATFGTKVSEEKEEKVETMDKYSYADPKNMSMFDDEKVEIPAYKYCGTVFSTYIVIEMADEMYIIDQHAAHERIMYEKIKQNFYSSLEKESQIMLLPDIITLSHKEKQIVKENTNLFKKAGFIMEEFGENTIRLIGVPAVCMDLDTKELFLEILDTIDTVAITARQEKEDKFIATIACKAAVKAKMSLTKEEIDSLMKKLLVLPNPFTCPHGRPTAIKMDKADIERKFNRRK